MPLKFIYSQLSSESLMPLVNAHYQNVSPVNCKFYARGLHDNYLIESAAAKYILRIYRNDWRNTDEILFELELLFFLREQKAKVSSPIRTTEEELGFFINFQEGRRMAALFDFADGRTPEKDTLINTSQLLGRAVASIHLASSGFVTKYTRPVLDVPWLLDQSIIRIEPFLDSEQMHYVTTLQKKIHAGMPVIAHENDAFGICTGDINFRNFHINERNEITLFDFDQCGYGYRAFELGKFLSAMYPLAEKDSWMQAFLKGYQSICQLSEAEILAIPYFEIVSIIWVLTIYVDNADRIGHILMDESFWKQRIERLKVLESRLANYLI
jgi:Ser/Thr protein kinase RdoA (MazF antagonist)